MLKKSVAVGHVIAKVIYLEGIIVRKKGLIERYCHVNKSQQNPVVIAKNCERLGGMNSQGRIKQSFE